MISIHEGSSHILKSRVTFDNLGELLIGNEGDIIDAASAFIEYDVERFNGVAGMLELFDTDDYKLGVILGISAARKKAEMLGSGSKAIAGLSDRRNET